jgi:T5SS/PEP-CTERM-associated repeat protein
VIYYVNQSGNSGGGTVYLNNNHSSNDEPAEATQTQYQSNWTPATSTSSGGTININSNVTLNDQRSGSYTFTSDIAKTGNGGFTANAGAYNMSNSNLTNNGGTFTLSNSNWSSISAISNASGATFNVNGTSGVTATTLTNSGTFNKSNTGAFNISGNLTNNSNSIFNDSGVTTTQVGGNLSNSGAYNKTGNTAINVTGTFTNSSTGHYNDTGTGNLQVTGAITNSGDFSKTVDGAITGSTLTNSGTSADMKIAGSTSMTIGGGTGTVTNTGGAKIEKEGTGAIATGNWTNANAAYTDSGSGNVTITGSLNNTQGSQFNKTGSGTLSVTQNVVNDAASSIDLAGTVVTTIAGNMTNQGHITKSGSGNITVNGTTGWANSGTGSSYVDTGTGNVSINGNGANLVNEGTFTKGQGDLYVNNNVINSGNFTKNGSGTFTVDNGYFQNTGNATIGGSTVTDIDDYIYNTGTYHDGGSGATTIHGTNKYDSSYANNTINGLSDNNAAIYNTGTFYHEKTAAVTTSLTGDLDTRGIFYGSGSGSITTTTDMLMSGYARWLSSGSVTGQHLVIGHADTLPYNPEQFHVGSGTIHATSTTDVGYNADSQLHIYGTGTVQSDGVAYVGSRNGNATGVVDINGNGTWKNNADVNIGNAGTTSVTTDSRGANIAYFGVNSAFPDNQAYYSSDPLTNTAAALASSQTGVLKSDASVTLYNTPQDPFTSYAATPIADDYGSVGQGTVNLTDNGTWDASGHTVNVGVAAAGAVNMGGGTWNDANTSIGNGTHVNIAAGSNRGLVNQFGGTHTDTGNAIIGNTNNGTYDLHGSSLTTWNTGNGATIANTNGVIGQVNVYDDAKWNITGNLVVGNDTGADGRGILRIDNRGNFTNGGGDVTVTNGNILMAQGTGAKGYTYVDGYGSTLTTTGNAGGTGNIHVAEGTNSYGRLDISRGGLADIEANAVIANADGSHGQTYIHGTDGNDHDATWIIHGNAGGAGTNHALIVANLGTSEGSLDIYKEGDVKVTSGNVIIANGASTFGTINVRNLDSSLSLDAGSLTVAEDGTGLLHISDRGLVNISSDMTIANNSTARGTTLVELFGTLNVGGNLITSSATNAEGNLYIRSGSKVNVSGNHTVADAANSIGRDHIDGNFTQLNVVGELNVAKSGQAGGHYTENRLDPRYQADPSNGIWDHNGGYDVDNNHTGYIAVSEGAENPYGEGTHTAQHGTGTTFDPSHPEYDGGGDVYTFANTTGDWNVNPAYNPPYPSGDALPTTPNDGKYTGNDPGLAITRGAHVNSGNATVGDEIGSYAYVVIDNRGFNDGTVDHSENAIDLNQLDSIGDGTALDQTALARSHQNVGATRSTWTVGTLDTAGTLRTAHAADGITNPVSGLSDYHQINTNGKLEIGRNGGEGMFRVIRGGLLHTGETIIADASGSRGYLHVDGFDTVSGRSEFISDGLTTVGKETGTRGTLRISDGARAVTEGLTIAEIAGSSGEVSVEGFYDRTGNGYSSDDVRSLLEIYQRSGGVAATETLGNSLFSASNHALVWMWEGSDLQLNGIGQITTGATLHLNGHVNGSGALDGTITGSASGDSGVPLFDANDFSVNVTNARVEGNGIIRAKEGVSFVQDSGPVLPGFPNVGQPRTPGQAEIDPGLFYGWDCICENPERYGTLRFETNTLSMTGNVITYFDVNQNGDRDRIFVAEDGETGRTKNVTASISGTLKMNARLTDNYYEAGKDYVYDVITTENNGLIQKKFDKVDVVPFAFFELAETDLGYGQTIDRMAYADPLGTGAANNGDILHVTMRAIDDPFERAGKTYNQKSTGHALDRLYAERNKDWLPVLRYFWNQYDPNKFLSAYSLFSGEIRSHSLLLPTSDVWSIATDRIGFSRKTGHALLGYQNRNFGREYGNGLWGSAIYNQTTTISDGNAYGYDLKRTGFVVGFDRVSQGGDSTIGALFHFNHGELETYHAGATDEDYQFGLYHARRILDYVEWKNYLGAGLQSYHTHRDLNVPMQDYTVCGVPGHPNSCPMGNCDMANGVCHCGGSLEEQRLRSRYHGYTFSASTELARPYYFGDMRQWTFRPFVGLNINAVWQNRSWEQGEFTGAELVALKFERVNLLRTYGRVGAGLERGGNHANMYLNAAYSYLLGGRRYTDVNNRFQLGGDEFNIRGVDDGSGFFTANVGGSIFLDKCKRGMVFLDYKVIAGSHSSTQAFQLGLQRNF